MALLMHQVVQKLDSAVSTLRTMEHLEDSTNQAVYCQGGQVQGIYDKLVEMKVKLDILVEPSICMMEEEICHTGSSNDMA